MKPLLKSLLLIFGLVPPLMQAQEGAAKVREIEQKVLQKQYQTAVDSLVDSARSKASPELIDKRLQWLTLVENEIEGGDKTSTANQEQMSASANTLNDLAWNMITSPDAGARHPDIALKLANIAIELGGEDKNLKPNMLDTKARALFLLGKHGEAIAEQEKAVAAVTVEKKAGFEATLDAYRKDELPKVSLPAKSNPETAATATGVAYIMGKLKTIVIPSVDFDNTTVEDAIDYLRKQSIQLDKAELDPSRKGVNIVVRALAPNPAAASGPASGEGLPKSIAEPGTIRIKGLHLRNVPLAVALKYICETARLRYKVDDFAVTLIHPEAPEDLFTRIFGVPLDFSSKLNSGSGAGKASEDLTARPPIIELLKSAGVNFGEGSSATLTASDTLMVTNKPSEMDKIEALIEAMTPGGR